MNRHLSIGLVMFAVGMIWFVTGLMLSLFFLTLKLFALNPITNEWVITAITMLGAVMMLLGDWIASD